MRCFLVCDRLKISVSSDVSSLAFTVLIIIIIYYTLSAFYNVNLKALHKQTNKQCDLCPVGLDARGVLFGPLLAQRLGVGFVLVRKKGKLPGPTVSVAHKLEYIEVKLAGDDRTLYAACELMKKQNAEVMGCMGVIELKELNGVEKLKPNILFSLVQYGGQSPKTIPNIPLKCNEL
uniref:adenine phosphoribosyltransferase n=1 Tax=Hucho hucho TaxID=62062 RepID=A0A4W5RG46_9TELE